MIKRSDIEVMDIAHFSIERWDATKIMEDLYLEIYNMLREVEGADDLNEVIKYMGETMYGSKGLPAVVVSGQGERIPKDV